VQLKLVLSIHHKTMRPAGITVFTVSRAPWFDYVRAVLVLLLKTDAAEMAAGVNTYPRGLKEGSSERCTSKLIEKNPSLHIRIRQKAQQNDE
jgi:hypothetical protein